MKQTYNGLFVPSQIKTDRIISAFCNEIDVQKIESYTEIMREQMLSHPFPPISGFPSIIDESNFGDCFLTGEEITGEHVGQIAWFVTDGHHRAMSAVNASLPFVETALDYSTITNETDFKNFQEQ